MYIRPLAGFDTDNEDQVVHVVFWSTDKGSCENGLAAKLISQHIGAQYKKKHI